MLASYRRARSKDKKGFANGTDSAVWDRWWDGFNATDIRMTEQAIFNRRRSVSTTSWPYGGQIPVLVGINLIIRVGLANA